MANTIVIQNVRMKRAEALASGSITPGMLIEQTSATTKTVKAHATAGGNVEHMFAIEDGLQGGSISDDYEDGERVSYMHCGPGDIVNALLNNGESVSIGDKLESAGNGRLQAHTPNVDSSAASFTEYTHNIVGTALDAVDMSDSSGADPSGRIRVRID
jgi:hypothetical protein